MDTDGSFYSYKHKINKKNYRNFATCFTSHSVLLLNSLFRILSDIGMNPSRSKNHIYLHRKRDIEMYMKLVGSRNPKHVNKYRSYMKERYGSGYNRTVSKTV